MFRTSTRLSWGQYWPADIAWHGASRVAGSLAPILHAGMSFFPFIWAPNQVDMRARLACARIIQMGRQNESRLDLGASLPSSLRGCVCVAIAISVKRAALLAAVRYAAPILCWLICLLKV